MQTSHPLSNVFFFSPQNPPKELAHLNRTELKELVGGKAAGLCELSQLGLPVPPGFVVSTAVCTDYLQHGQISLEVQKQIRSAITQIEQSLKLQFGSNQNPLLVSVRSGARVSMPGMMDTILNLGLNDITVLALAKRTQNPRFAWDSYRRFIQMFAEVVLNVSHSKLHKALDEMKIKRGFTSDTEVTAEAWQELCTKYRQIIRETQNKEFPQDVYEQLFAAVGAVFNSWTNEKACVYRKQYQIPEEWGTAVTVQTMVFGNMGDDCATGVAFTRDPNTGAKQVFGEYLPNAQGEDVVAGIRTPYHLEDHSQLPMDKKDLASQKAMNHLMPKVYAQLKALFSKLELHYKDMLDIEFTVMNETVYLLQTRTGKRSAKAALKIALDMLDEGVISAKEAVLRVGPEVLDQMLHPQVSPSAAKDIWAKGLPASPGAACGQIVFSPEKAVEWVAAGREVVLVRHETSPEDIKGMIASRGFITSLGGMTSHAAVVARGMGKPCITAVESFVLDYENNCLRVGAETITEGTWVTFDGSCGQIYKGQLPLSQSKPDELFYRFLKLTDQFKRLKVRTNADTPQDVRVALDFGAEGIGLCRTEHMFFQEDRITSVRQMILSENILERKGALAKILPMQQADFFQIFQAMNGRPINIRLLDPPLHEFLPQQEKDFELLAQLMGRTVSEIRLRSEKLRELNPMLGHRGCRLGITFPEIYQMQVEAIISAAVKVQKGTPAVPVQLEIMVPLVSDAKELLTVRKLIEGCAQKIFELEKFTFSFQIGTMIELPRAAINAASLAVHSDFFSFGTNDLTQTTYGLSRDDIGEFLPTYLDQKIYPADPFLTLDQEGVGFLISHALEKGKGVKPSLKVGVCGEHGGEARSIEFFERVGLDYISASPYRVPVARLAAAQAALNKN